MLKQLARTHTNLQAVVLRRNYGQTAPMAAGFKHAQGSAIVTLDADLQNDQPTVAAGSVVLRRSNLRLSE